MNSRRRFLQSATVFTPAAAAAFMAAAGPEISSAAPIDAIPDTVNVTSFGATGNGATDDTNAIQAAVNTCFGPASAPHAINYYQNRALYFPPGHYMITSPILFTKLQGGCILGAGRFTSTIENRLGGSVFVTNGCGFSHFEGLCLRSSGNAAIFDLNWDGTGPCGALQSNTFIDVFFDTGAFGIKIGGGNFMGSENLFLNCFWIRCSTAGLITCNPNALQQTLIGGDFQSCGNAIWCAGGSVPVVHGVGFQNQGYQNQNQYDIRIDYSANDTMSLVGCRTESQNFVYASSGMSVHIDACSQTSSTLGDFLLLKGGPAIVSCCTSVAGRVAPCYNALLSVENSSFGRSDWIQPNQLWWKPNNRMAASIEIDTVTYGWAATGVYSQIAKQRIIPDPTKSGAPLTYTYVLQPGG